MRRALGIPELDHATARRGDARRRSSSRPIRTSSRRCASCASAGMTVVIASNWDCSLPEWLRPTGILEPGGRRGHLGRGRARPSRARACSSGRSGSRASSRRRRCTWATRSTTTSRAPRRPESAACCSSARAIRRPAWSRSARFASCPPYSDVRAARRLRTAAPASARPAGAAGGRRAALAGLVRGRGLPGRADRDADRGGDRSRPPRAPPQTTRTRRSRSSPRSSRALIFIGTAVLFASFTRKPQAGAVRAAAHALLAGGRLGGARDAHLLRAGGALLA